MSGSIKILLLLAIGLAGGALYNATGPATHFQAAGGPRSLPVVLELWSYAAGLAAGMVLWQLGQIEWLKIPDQIKAFLISKMQFYQFVTIVAGCIAVLVYF